MLSVYWPRKSIPEWLEEIRFSGESNGVPKAYHRGFGVIVKRRGEFIVWGACGTFIYINGAGMSLKVRGQGNGVDYYTSFSGWCRALFSRGDKP